MEVSGQLHSQGALHPGKPKYPSNRRLGGPHSQSGSLGELRKALAPAGIRTPDRPARGIMAVMAPEELGKSLEASHSRQAVSWPRQASRTRRQFSMNAAASTSLCRLHKDTKFAGVRDAMQPCSATPTNKQ